jgi:hypothetical protein
MGTQFRGDLRQFLVGLGVLPTPSHPNLEGFDFDGSIFSRFSRKSLAWTAVVQPSMPQFPA